MSWPGAWRARLDEGALVVALAVAPLNTESGYGDASYSLGMAPGWADTGARMAMFRAVAQQLQPRTWAVTLGGWNFRVIGDPRAFARACPRGTVLGLYAALDSFATTAGIDASGYVRVGVGVVQDVQPVFEGDGPKTVFAGLEVTVVDAPKAMQGRLVNSGGAHPLFYTVGSTTTLSSTAAVGDATYNVASTTGFARRLGGSYPYGCVLVTPASSSDGAYCRLWSASTATTLTIQSAATASRIGTTDIGAASGDAVTECWYLRGHPLDIAREVLVSRTGNGANSSYDILPEGWGIGLDAQLMDDEDIENWKNSALLAPASGSLVWELAGTDQKDDPWAWLAGWLGEAGYFLAMRQGCVTVRPAQSTDLSTVRDTGILIDDSDIMSVTGGSFWDGSLSPEFYQTRVASVGASSSRTTAEVVSLPAGDVYVYDVGDRLWSNESAVTTMDCARLAQATTQIPERVMLMCRGLRLASLTLGDVVHLSTYLIPSRLNRTSFGFLNAAALVVSHAVEWERGYVKIGLCVYPTGSES